MKQYTTVVDLDRCIGCRACVVACKTAHDIPVATGRNTLYNVGPFGRYPELQMYFMTVMCQQCAEPACVRACPTGATYKDREDGIIRINKEICIACESCSRACPYECNALNDEMMVMDKCDLCTDLRANGEEPACVRTCPSGAIHYGDIRDPDSEISRLLREAGEENVYSFPDTGTHPTARFILRKATWQDTLPQTFPRRQGGKHRR